MCPQKPDSPLACDITRAVIDGFTLHYPGRSCLYDVSPYEREKRFRPERSQLS